MTADGLSRVTPSCRFGDFVLDPADRRLSRGGMTVDLNARYLDALILLASEPGRLVAKDRFMAEVWKGVPVTDEALTQCIRALRKALGDDAARPRFIETAPRHGYRFIAAVEPLGAPSFPPETTPVQASSSPPEISVEVEPRPDWRRFRVRAAAGMIGGGGAGLVGGLIYGLVGASGVQGSGMGTSSVLVLTGLTLWIGLVGGAGVGVGIAAANLRSARPGLWSIGGGAVGGLLVGGLVKLIGMDAFALLLGQSPGAITGAGEGAALGAAIGLGLWLGGLGTDRLRARRGAAIAGLCGGIAGVLIALSGGRLMAGSLHELAARFPASRLQMDAFGALFGEPDFGPVTRVASAGLEGLLFAACVVGMMILAGRSLDRVVGQERDAEPVRSH